MVWTRRKGVVLGIGLALTLGGFGAVRAAMDAAATRPPATFRLADPNEGPSRSSFAPVVKKALPAVVEVTSSKVVKTPAGFFGPGQMDPFFRQFFGDDSSGRFNAPREQREQGVGSGVIVSPEGYILTNNHVVDGAKDVRVVLTDKREFKASVVGTDAKTDIAVLKIDGSGLSPIMVGDSSKVQVGDYALAIGNPFGVGQTVTMGIVSATGRGGLGIEDYEDFIQTDAPINPGNSGGALVNDRGELIGINTAILSHGSGGNQGIGFAVPVNLARQVMDQILKNGKVTRAYLGVVPQDVTPAMAKAFGVKEQKGALVGDVSPNSPAQRAGLERGDIILDVNGKEVADANGLRMTISMMQPDSTVSFKILRDGNTRELTAKLGELEPPRGERASAEKPGSESGLEGVAVENLTPQTARELGLPANTPGVVVADISPSSPVAGSGLQEGDVIQEVNRKPVKNVADYQQALRSAGKEPLLLVNRHGNTLYVAA
ncbi:MAG: DegQ family serine endoprotease [Bryobacterales bacterium]|nr:DegQ family serine endoprotease [Bryobacterales bacterium]